MRRRPQLATELVLGSTLALSMAGLGFLGYAAARGAPAPPPRIAASPLAEGAPPRPRPRLPSFDPARPGVPDRPAPVLAPTPPPVGDDPAPDPAEEIASGDGGPAIAGVVTGLAGEPLADATVLAVGAGAVFETRTDASGRFHLDGIVAGTYAVSAASPSHLPGGPVLFDAGEAPRDAAAAAPCRIVLEPGLAMDGTVAGPHGEVVPARVLVTGPVDAADDGAAPVFAAEVVTDEAGRFAIGGLAPGLYAVAAAPLDPRFSESPAAVVAAGTPGVWIVAEVAGALHGVVRARADGGPVADAFIVLEAAPGARGARAARTGPDGAFGVEGLAPGAYRLLVRAGEGPPAEAGRVVVSGGETAAVEVQVDVDLSLDRP